MFASGEISPFLLITGPVLIVVSYWLSLKAFTAKYTISLEEVKAKSIWGDKNIQWIQVKNIWINSNLFGGYGFNLELVSGKRYLILFSIMSNHEEVAQAIIEAATTSNPQVQIRGLGQDAYGAPPYGIFTEQGQTHEFSGLESSP